MDMDKLLEKASDRTEAAEIYSVNGSRTNVSFENSKLKSINRSDQFGLAMRVVAGGKLGLGVVQRGGELALLLLQLRQGLLQVDRLRLAVGGHGLQTVDLRLGLG